MTEPLQDGMLRRLADVAGAQESSSEARLPRLGRRAVLRRYITSAHLKEALKEQDRRRSAGDDSEPLGQILLRLGMIDRADLEELLRESASGTPRLRRYEIREKLGEGSEAVVYRALDRELGREVAVKILRSIPSFNCALRWRFHREAQAAARLSHPNLVALYDVGDEGGLTYLIMELVPGRAFGHFLRRGIGRLRRRVDLLRGVAEGLHHAHQRGIIHRDVKPENILVSESGPPKLTDFGLAHFVGAEVTRSGAKLGTPMYMAPEQVEGRSRAVTARTDVYGLGAVLYHAVTGRPPHPGSSLLEIFRRIVGEDPPRPRRLNPKISRELEAIVLKSLEKAPARRYETAAALAQDLSRYLAGVPTLARPEGAARRLCRSV